MYARRGLRIGPECKEAFASLEFLAPAGNLGPLAFGSNNKIIAKMPYLKIETFNNNKQVSKDFKQSFS